MCEFASKNVIKIGTIWTFIKIVCIPDVDIKKNGGQVRRISRYVLTFSHFIGFQRWNKHSKLISNVRVITVI